MATIYLNDSFTPEAFKLEIEAISFHSDLVRIVVNRRVPLLDNAGFEPEHVHSTHFAYNLPYTMNFSLPKRIKFETALQMAKWITTNITDPLEQEILMLRGCANSYTLFI